MTDISPAVSTARCNCSPTSAKAIKNPVEAREARNKGDYGFDVYDTTAPPELQHRYVPANPEVINRASLGPRRPRPRRPKPSRARKQAVSDEPKRLRER